MKTTIPAIILACTILAVPFLLVRKDKSDIEDLQTELRSLKGRVDVLKGKIAIIEFNAKHNEQTAKRVVAEVRKIVDGVYYSHIIPVSRGYLMVREEK